MTQVTELHLHDHYSFLDGYNTPAEYMVRAKELGMTHLAQTNHGTLSGHRAFQRAAKDAGIVPILGVEAYISQTDRFDRRSKAKRTDGTQVYNHIILLAQDEVGLKTLNRLSEKAWTEGFYSKPRIDRDLLFDDNEGLIVLSGCMNGLVARAVENGDMNHAMNIAREFKDNLGDRFYMEVQGHNPVALNYGLLDVADKLGIKPVTTSDCHYARSEELFMEQALLILSTNPKKRVAPDMSKADKMEILDRFDYLYPDRTMTFREIEIFLRDYQTHQDLYAAQGIDRTDILSNTMEVANRIGDYPYYSALDILPRPVEGDPDSILKVKVYEGLKARGLDKDPVYIERAKMELGVIKKKKFATYFIILADLMDWVDSQGIPRGPGRGSSAGSLVCYALKVTEADPIQYKLIFSRFLDESRSDWPDVDLDFSDRARGQIKQYLTEKYTHVASIATFTTYNGKSTVRDAARAYGVPLVETNKVLKDNDAPDDSNYIDFFLESEKGKVFARKYPMVIKIARGLYGRIRGGGMHAAGVVISSVPLETVAPVQTAEDPNAKGERIQYIALDHEEVADIGGIKYDILGLKNLRIIDDAVKAIKRRHGVTINQLEIPLDDNATYEMLARGETRAVFQADGGAFTKWILENKCDEFMDLVKGTSIARPGAMNTVGKDYRARLFGEQMVEYANDIVYEITKDTLGLVVFQEQVMQMMTNLAGMSMADANKVRKIIGKKRDVSEFEQYRQAFIDGAAPKLGSEAKAAKLWKDFEAHAGYSFNLSHAVVYSLVTYWTAYLKCHYPLEYMTAALLAEEKKEKKTFLLIEAKRMGIPVYLPHVNHSAEGPTIQGDGIRLGLGNIKNISAAGSKKLMAQRPFENYGALVAAVTKKYSGMNARMLSSMNAVGAAEFDDNPLKGNERENLYEYLGIPAFSLDVPASVVSRVSPAEDFMEDATMVLLGVVLEIKRGPGWARVTMIDESGSATAFASQDVALEEGQMYAFLVANNSIIKFVKAEDIDPKNGMLSKYLYGEVVPPREDRFKVLAFKPRKTKKGDDMGTAILMDSNGKLGAAMVWPQSFRKMEPVLSDDRVVDVELREMEDGTVFIHALRSKHGY